jgi:hypothetical protein
LKFRLPHRSRPIESSWSRGRRRPDPGGKRAGSLDGFERILRPGIRDTSGDHRGHALEGSQDRSIPQPSDNLGTLAAKAPGTQFVAISSLNWTPPANVTLIHEDENDATFLAGYTAAFLAPNFRVGALLPAEDPSLDLAFQNGVAYYCGTCSSQITPLQSYPIVSVQSGSSTPDVWQAAFDQINLNKINVLYVAKAAMSTQLLSYLASKDVAVIANEATPDASFTNWAATIDLDPITPLKEIWNDLLAGTGGKSVNATSRSRTIIKSH